MNIIKRYLFNDLLSAVNSKEILLIIGHRQCGKTTLMKFVQERLEKNNEKTAFFNMDYEEDIKYFETQKKFIDKLKLEFGDEKAFVFIDEIQRKENAGLFLKGIYDLDLPYKFIVSGSGSLELKEKIHESLAGRKIIFEMTTLTFEEFVNFKTNYAYEKNLKNFFEVEKSKSEEFLSEYMSFGGYPKCVLSSTEREKKIQIDEIYKSYIEKDISYWLKIDKIYAFSNLIKHLSFYTGKIINYS
ncbi:MAG: AAA family ATPase, partial [Elusimicrobia bacterium]|nr:AAA family ATPase [Elusimicrobiota bacterium]